MPEPRRFEFARNVRARHHSMTKRPTGIGANHIQAGLDRLCRTARIVGRGGNGVQQLGRTRDLVQLRLHLRTRRDIGHDNEAPHDVAARIEMGAIARVQIHGRTIGPLAN